MAAWRDGFVRMIGGVPASEFREVRASLAEQESYVRRLQGERARNAVSSGVEFNYGQFDYEYQSNLVGDAKWLTLDKMVNDPHVKGTLRSNTFSLFAAEWDVLPASDSDRDIEVAEFIKAVLLRQPSDRFGTEYFTSTSWMQRLYEILGMLEHGYAMFHLSWKAVRGTAGTRRVFDLIQWLEPSSVDPRGWEINDADQIVSIKRTFQTPTGKYKFLDPMPADELALYPWEMRGARFEGRPFIRPMYGPWFRKDFMQRMATIWAQKVGAPVPVGHYPTTWDATTRTAFEDFIQSLRGTAPAEAFGMFPLSDTGDAAKIHYAGADTGEVDRMGSLVQSENLEIAHAGGTKAQLLGETDSGSRAVGRIQASSDLMTTQAVAEWVCEVETNGIANMPGLIERLVQWNYGNVRAPRLVCSKIDPYSGLQHVTQLVAATTAGLVPNHPELRKQITERFGFSLPDDAYEVEPAVPEAEAEADPADDEDQASQDDTGSETPEQDDAEMSLGSLDDFKRRIAPMLEPMEGAPSGGGFRTMSKLESVLLNLAEVNETYRVGERDLLNEFRGIRRQMVDDLMGRLRAGKVTARNLESQRRSKFRREASARASIERVVVGVGQRGMGHVAGEVRRGMERGRHAA